MMYDEKMLKMLAENEIGYIIQNIEIAEEKNYCSYSWEREVITGLSILNRLGFIEDVEFKTLKERIRKINNVVR